MNQKPFLFAAVNLLGPYWVYLGTRQLMRLRRIERENEKTGGKRFDTERRAEGAGIESSGAGPTAPAPTAAAPVR